MRHIKPKVGDYGKLAVEVIRQSIHITFEKFSITYIPPMVCVR